MNQKIKDMLDSEELEMVRLGVHLMKQEIIDKKEWARILEMFKYKQSDGPEDFYQLKYDWEIKDDEIIISKPDILLRNYRIRTGTGGMKLIQEAMKNWKP